MGGNAGGAQTVEGRDYQVFAMADPKLGYKFRLLIDPQTTMLHQLGLNGQEKQINFSVTETMTRQSPAGTQPELPVLLHPAGRRPACPDPFPSAPSDLKEQLRADFCFPLQGRSARPEKDVRQL